MPTFHDEHSVEDSMLSMVDSDMSFISEATPQGTELSMVSVAPPVAPEPLEDAPPDEDMVIDEDVEKDVARGKVISEADIAPKVRQRKCFWVLVAGTVLLIATVGAMIVFMMMGGGGGGASSSVATSPDQQGPTQPTPGQPSQPSPGQPSQPNPGQPSQPNPGQPSQPNPGQPSPSQPTQPNPGQPSQPNPGQPSQPSPSQPTQPNPGQPSQPSPSQPEPTPNPTEPTFAQPSEPTPSPTEPTFAQPSEPTPSPTEPTFVQPSDPPPSPVAAPVGATPAPTLELLSFLKPKLPDGGYSLQYTDSYQSKAFTWLENNHVPLQHNAQRILQRFALACIFYATYSVETPYTIQELGEGLIFGWIKSTGWVDDADECTWHGIACNNQGLVEEIDLSKNFLTGRFPPEVVLLKDSLLRLDLFRNNFYNPGDTWNSFMGELTLLEDLNIGQTGFEYDGIPTYLGQLSNLVDLDVSYSLFFGSLKPGIFDNLPNLEYLYIGGNSFNSPIPSTFSKLGKLKYFYAEFTDLTGDLSFFKNPSKHPEMYEVWIDKNPLVTSEIPPEL